MSKRGQQKKLDHIVKLYDFDKQEILSFVASAFPSGPTAGGLTPRSRLNKQLYQKTDDILIAGFDEAGRGALAGPVMVGCVHFPSFLFSSSSDMLDELYDLDDSKKLSAKKREQLIPRIKNNAMWGIGIASAIEIDELGIVQAVSLAAKRAYEAMGVKVQLILCDRGITVLQEELAGECFNSSKHQSTETSTSQFHQLSFIHGDSRSLHIAAASVLAKVARDQMMVDLHTEQPEYGFALHKGYGTAAHIDALHKLGPSSQHRKTFKWNKANATSLLLL